MSPRATRGKGRATRSNLLRVTELPGLGSDRERGPYRVDECAVVRDALDPQARSDGRTWFDVESEWYQSNAGDRDPARAEAYLRLSGACRTLFAYAVDVARETYKRAEGSRREIARARRSWLVHGLIVRVESHDAHVHCLFCQEYQNTLSGHKVDDATWNALTRHAERCAFEYLARLKRTSE